MGVHEFVPHEELTEEEISEKVVRDAVMIKHPLTVRAMVNRFQYVNTYAVSKGRFRELFQCFVEEFGEKPGLVAGQWWVDGGGPSRALAWCGQNGERVMMVCDGAANQDDSRIHLGFSNFEVLPDLACKHWKPLTMKANEGRNAWGIPIEELTPIERYTVYAPKPKVVKKGFWARLFNL